MILSPFLMVFVIVSVLALLVFAILTAFDVRSRSIRRRMAQYVSVPTEEESSIRRAEVASMLTGHAQRRVAGQEWWQSFEKDVELGGFRASATTLAGWTLIAGILASLVVAIASQSLFGLLAGLAAPFVLRFYVTHRVSSMRKAFGEQLPDNLEVLAGALRAGHSLVGAMNVMVDGADEPSKSEFRRVLSGRAARHPDRPGADGDVASAWRTSTSSRSRSSRGSSARPAATRPRFSTASSRTSAAGWRSAG